ncbi:protein argonaute-2 isoform X4 [Nylanderia fulva]|uniref:protein argonaute-2 isoform X4 n=1 Tax=Nylanderia fulva TaxID=613905 RepID=UPI0010FBB954|nr:protein argonaute-2 isoform X4 [Nylanderia fulva]
MPRKGKKKLSALEAGSSSTSKAEEKPQKQVAQSIPQQQQVPPQQPQQQGVQGQPQQQTGAQQPKAWGQPSQQPAQGPQPQQPGARGQQPQGSRPQQPGAWSQQPQGPPQQQGAWGQRPPQQTVTQGPPPQQQGTWGQRPGGPRPQQPGVRGQQPQGPRPQGPRPQQPGAWSQQPQGPPQQQGAWGQRPPQQTVTQGPPFQQPQGPPQQQGAWGQRPPQQTVTQGPPPQQQGAWGQRPGGPQPQQPGAWSQQPQGPRPQQPGAWSQQPQGPPQQQEAWGQRSSQQTGTQGLPSQQQQAWARQQAPIDIGAAGDSKLVTGKGSMTHGDTQQQQATTSAQSQLSQLTLRDTLHTAKTSGKAKMSSEAMKQYQLSIPKRQNPLKAGTLGIPIKVYTNMFEIIFNQDFVTNAVHYDVDITPTASKAIYRKIFEQCRFQNFSNRYPAFDGKKNAYSANDLPFDDSMQNELEVCVYEDEYDRVMKTYKITLKKVGNIDLKWIKNLKPGLDEANRDQTGIQVLDVIMRHAPESQFLSVGRSLYWDFDSGQSLTGGLSLSRGGFSTAVLGWKPLINIDIAHKGFPTAQNVLSLMAEFTQEEVPSPQEVNKRWNREKIEKFLKGLKIIYQMKIKGKGLTKRTYRVNGLGPSAVEHRFSHENQMMSIQQYFMKYKEYNLQYPHLPCLWVGATNRPEKIFLPAELCAVMPKQAVNRKLDEEQTTKMIKYAATDAPTRKYRIEQAFRKIDVNNSPVMRNEFHLSVRPEMKQVAARVLPPPDLQYNNKKGIVRQGIWKMQAFQQASNLNKGTWTILDLSDSKRDTHYIHEFAMSLMDYASEVGMNIEEPQSPFRQLRSSNISEIHNYFGSKKDLKLIIVIISDRMDTTYGKVKQITELSVGILTQCIKFRTATKNNYITVKNILLKINSKLNGINHTLHSASMPKILKNNDCMIVGADVTHPSPDAINIPSIAAVAASSNHSAFQYNIALRLQPPKEEMILDIEQIIISQLHIYKSKTKCLPNKIIYYRDGVSEGQLAQVMYHEINAIKRACNRVKAPNIQITCLVVQKRHHVRLFPTNDKESDDKNKNVRAGTIVDTEITHPNHIDFYLVSHASIQGTARPTKYRCICNDSQYTEDDIEQLTYYLCHMYARCTRAVSYPAPTYYAHLGAYRGRALIQGVDIRMEQLEQEQNKLYMKISENSPMCFV